MEQLQVFMDDASFLYPFKSGFWPGSGIQAKVVVLPDNFRCHLDRVGHCYYLLLNLDMVAYLLLAHCLADAWIQGTALQWLLSLL